MATEIAIIAGSEKDLLVMKDTATFFDQVGINYQIMIMNSFKNAESLVEFSKKAHINGFKVIIAGSAGATNLPGFIAALSPLPVIGVPIQRDNAISGLDSILSVLQMPIGLPVATMSVNNGKNAGIFAMQILSLNHPGYQELIIAFKKQMKEENEFKNEKLQKKGYIEYIEDLKNK